MAGTSRAAVTTATRLIAVWLGTVAVLFGASLVADAVPDEMVVDTLVSSAQSGAWDLNETMNAFGLPSDRFTECVAFTQGLGNDERLTNGFEYSVADLDLAPDGCLGLLERLTALQRGEFVQGNAHFRYWNGADTILRPLLAFTDIATLRIVVGAGLLSAFALFLFGLARLTGWASALAFAVPVTLTTDLLAMPASATHAITWTVILGSGAMLAWLGRRGKVHVAAVALVAGSLFAFFDLLTNPPAAVMVLLLVGLALALETS